MAASAYALPVLDFNIDPPHAGGESISYDGIGGPLVGINITVDDITGINTPLNSGVDVAIFGGVLTFTTGNYSGGGWDFGGGGFITITGGVDLNHNGVYDAGTDIAPGTVLMSGSWTSAQVVAVGDTFKITGGSFYDFKLAELVYHFGLPDGTLPYTGNINLSFSAPPPSPGASPPYGFTSTEVYSGDVTNSPTPEPGTLMLMGTGLAGIAGYARLKFKRKKKA
jgi:hypothetical protein